MRISICNIAQQSDDKRTKFSPIAPLVIIQALRSAGYTAEFFDIDGKRPSVSRIKEYFEKNKFDVVGISAIVSTAYCAVKELSSLIRSVSPDTVIVLGGGLTAASEIILKFTDVDFCVISEGEKIMVNLVKYISSHGRKIEEEALKNIRGLCFKNGKNDVIFTGYEKPLSVDDIQYPDYGIVKEYSDINNYIVDVKEVGLYFNEFKADGRIFGKDPAKNKLAIIVTSRGCIHHCTFCHRAHQGIRIFPVDKVIKYIQYLKEAYNVGFISFGDENFGASKKWTEEFIEKIKPLDMLYRIQGVCCENMNPELLKGLKESGCCAIQYGFESGSDRMLKVIEKKSDAAMNEQVAKWMHEMRLSTSPAFIVGMPGESYQTIEETSRFAQRITEFLPQLSTLTVKLLVALPGAPVYEYARYRGFLGKRPEDEEKYLIRVSNEGGGSIKQLNLTDYPYFIVQGWVRCICWSAYHNYYKKRDYPRVSVWKLAWNAVQILLKRKKKDKDFYTMFYSCPFIYNFRYVIAPVVSMAINCRQDKKLFLTRFVELLAWPFRKKMYKEHISVRQFLKENTDYMKNCAPFNVQTIRMGR